MTQGHIYNHLILHTQHVFTLSLLVSLCFTFGNFTTAKTEPMPSIYRQELLGISGNQLDYVAVKGATTIDFRGDNMANFESLEKNSLDIYSSMKSVYLQDRENKINNSTSSGEEDWGNLDK